MLIIHPVNELVYLLVWVLLSRRPHLLPELYIAKKELIFLGAGGGDTNAPGLRDVAKGILLVLKRRHKMHNHDGVLTTLERVDSGAFNLLTTVLHILLQERSVVLIRADHRDFAGIDTSFKEHADELDDGGDPSPVAVGSVTRFALREAVDVEEELPIVSFQMLLAVWDLIEEDLAYRRMKFCVCRPLVNASSSNEIIGVEGVGRHPYQARVASIVLYQRYFGDVGVADQQTSHHRGCEHLAEGICFRLVTLEDRRQLHFIASKHDKLEHLLLAESNDGIGLTELSSLINDACLAIEFQVC